MSFSHGNIVKHATAVDDIVVVVVVVVRFSDLRVPERAREVSAQGVVYCLCALSTTHSTYVNARRQEGGYSWNQGEECRGRDAAEGQ